MLIVTASLYSLELPHYTHWNCLTILIVTASLYSLELPHYYHWNCLTILTGTTSLYSMKLPHYTHSNCLTILIQTISLLIGTASLYSSGLPHYTHWNCLTKIILMRSTTYILGEKKNTHKQNTNTFWLKTAFYTIHVFRQVFMYKDKIRCFIFLSKGNDSLKKKLLFLFLLENIWVLIRSASLRHF